MWFDDITDYNKANWISLKAELDYVTDNRFTKFFCNTVLCCDKLLAEFKPFISRNLTLLKKSEEELYGGSVLERQGMSASVGGASYSIQSMDALRNKFGTFESPTLLPQLLMLVQKYGLTYPAPMSKEYMCSFACGRCTKCENPCESCGGDEC